MGKKKQKRIQLTKNHLEALAEDLLEQMGENDLDEDQQKTMTAAFCRTLAAAMYKVERGITPVLYGHLTSEDICPGCGALKHECECEVEEDFKDEEEKHCAECRAIINEEGDIKKASPRPIRKKKPISEIRMHNFETQLRDLINVHSLENDSNTPDFLLARYLRRCLENFNDTIEQRTGWTEEQTS